MTRASPLITKHFTSLNSQLFQSLNPYVVSKPLNSVLTYNSSSSSSSSSFSHDQLSIQTHQRSTLGITGSHPLVKPICSIPNHSILSYRDKLAVHKEKLISQMKQHNSKSSSANNNNNPNSSNNTNNTNDKVPFFERLRNSFKEFKEKSPPLVPTQAMLKPFEASTSLNHFKYAKPFPPAVLKAISGKEVNLQSVFGKGVTLVTISFDQFGLTRNDSFTVPFQKEFSQVPKVNFLDIRMNRISWLGFVIQVIARNLLKELPEDRHDSTFCLPNIQPDITTPLDISYFMGNFIYLVDEQGFIRWQAVGFSKPKEVAALLQCTSALVQNIGQHHLMTRSGPNSLSTSLLPNSNSSSPSPTATPSTVNFASSNHGNSTLHKSTLKVK